MNEDAKYKILKMQYNELCDAGIFLEDREVSLFSKLSTLQVTNTSIHLQPDPSGSINLTSMLIRQPIALQSNLPLDFLPGLTNPSPRKTYDMPVEQENEEMKPLSLSIAGFLAVWISI